MLDTGEVFCIYWRNYGKKAYRLTSQPSGQRVEDKLAWAYEIVERYEYLEDILT